MEHNFLVANDGTITNPKEPLYLCEWNSGDIVQIHTRESLYDFYKDTNLYDTDEHDLNEWDDRFEGINELLDHLETNDEDAFNGRFDNEVYRNDNMTIQRIY
tara:strand:+ start:341 stop:646 length:306 start_codon:yes stop_codon:yes gene_type:complete